MTLWQTRRELFSRILAVGALFSGVALVTHIISGVSLRLGLAVTAGLLVLAVGSILRRTDAGERARIVKRTAVGLLSGLLATAAYDLSKFALSQWEASPYNPFETIHLFGVLLVGSSVGQVVTYGAGAAFHLLNGTCFGIAFCFMLRRPGIIAGIVWGLFLEIFQLTLYPGWLDIRFYNEFVQISALSHGVYGVVLGLSCQYGLRAWRA